MSPLIVARFWSKVNVSAGFICWEWKAGLFKSGYGSFSIDKKSNYAHRIAYTLFKGEIPGGLHIDHMCMNKKCVNPQHLRAVTPTVNALENSNCATAVNARKTHCIRGHEFTPENTRMKPTGSGALGRVCIACDAYWKNYERTRKRRSRKFDKTMRSGVNQ